MQFDDRGLSRFDPLKLIPRIDTELGGNTLHEYLLALLSFLLIWGLLYFLRYLGLRRLQAYATKAPGRTIHFLQGLFQGVKPVSFAFIALFVVTRRLEMPQLIDNFIKFMALAVLTLQVVEMAGRLVGFLIRQAMYHDKDPIAENTARNLSTLAKAALWAAGVLFLLDNFGVNISTFVAGLGIGGVAIALAAQAILGDTFSSFAIALDKPFEVGDFIIVDGLAGSVEHIGLKTTRVRALSGELLVFANSDLTKSRIQNFKRMFQRRVVFTIGVDYRTPRETLKQIAPALKGIVESQPKTRFDRAHFMRYGESSLDFEVVYYLMDPDYNLHMDIQQEIFFRIHEAFEKMGVEIPFPARTLYMAKQISP